VAQRGRAVGTETTHLIKKESGDGMPITSRAA